MFKGRLESVPGMIVRIAAVPRDNEAGTFAQLDARHHFANELRLDNSPFIACAAHNDLLLYPGVKISIIACQREIARLSHELVAAASDSDDRSYKS